MATDSVEKNEIQEKYNLKKKKSDEQEEKKKEKFRRNLNKILESEKISVGEKRKPNNVPNKSTKEIKPKPSTTLILNSSNVEVNDDSDKELRGGQKNKKGSNDPKHFKSLQLLLKESEVILVESQERGKKYYVAKVLKEKGSNNELEVSYFRKYKNSNKFLLPMVPDLKAVHMNQIKAILLLKTNLIQTRQKDLLSFNYDFSQLRMG